MQASRVGIQPRKNSEYDVLPEQKKDQKPSKTEWQNNKNSRIQISINPFRPNLSQIFGSKIIPHSSYSWVFCNQDL